MKTRLFYYLLFLLGILNIACSNLEVIDETKVPEKNDTLGTGDEKITIPFDYKYLLLDKRPHLTCETYSSSQIDELNRQFEEAIRNSKTTRGKVVSAGLFLVSMDYCIPYAFPIWLSLIHI